MNPSADNALHPMAGIAPTAVTPPALADQLLDGDEIIELSLKPSLWFVAGYSGPYVAGLVLLALGFWLTSNGADPALRQAVLQLFAVLVAGVLVLGGLAWASRVYLLTNRRVMCFSGMLAVRVTECRLARVATADLVQTAAQRPLGLGNIFVTGADAQTPRVDWLWLARPRDVHERLLRAIQRARMDPG